MKKSFYITVSYTMIVFFTTISLTISRKTQFIFSVIIMYLGYLFLIFIEDKYQMQIDNYIKILVVLTIILHNIGGQFLNLYFTSQWFDKALHVFGSFSFSLLFYSIIVSLIKGVPRTRMFSFLFVLSLGLSLGVILEIIEFILDKLFNSNHQNGHFDTNLDLISDLIGSIIGGLKVLRTTGK